MWRPGFCIPPWAGGIPSQDCKHHRATKRPWFREVEHRKPLNLLPNLRSQRVHLLSCIASGSFLRPSRGFPPCVMWTVNCVDIVNALQFPLCALCVLCALSTTSSLTRISDFSTSTQNKAFKRFTWKRFKISRVLGQDLSSALACKTPSATTQQNDPGFERQCIEKLLIFSRICGTSGNIVARPLSAESSQWDESRIP